MKIVLMGINHRTASVEIRERLSRCYENDGAALASIMELSDVREAMRLSTCNRLEILVRVERRREAVRELKEQILLQSGLSTEELEGCMYVFYDHDAVRHIFRVASSLDSMIIGEPQILGQVKDAFRFCVENEGTGPMLNRLLHRAFRTAKRVRTETGISSNAVSVSYAAVRLARDILGDLSGRNVLLVGAGEVAELAGRHLLQNGAGKIYFANRTYGNAVRLAHDYEGEPVRIDGLMDIIRNVDVLISSTGSSGYVITRAMLENAHFEHRERVLLCIDIAVPRDIEPSAGEIASVHLFNIDDLRHIVDENIEKRQEEMRAAEAIIDEEVLNFDIWFHTLPAVPVIAELKRRVDEIRDREIEKSGAWLSSLDERQKAHVTMLVKSVANKVVHDPIKTLKEETRNGDGARYMEAFKKLFQLDAKKKL